MSDKSFDPRELIGKRVSTYQIRSLIGVGGMGVVYEARDLSLDRPVALKVLRPDLHQDREFESRFVREARVVAKLEHEGIVRVYAAGRHQDLLFIAMQRLEGRTLDEHVKERGPLSVEEALRITREVARALDYAHSRGLMHRDIKPTNIFLEKSGTVKIMDFGLARSVTKMDSLTKTGVFYGTPEYSSPEQCTTTEIDARTDLFSIGVVLYEMLAGKVPFVAETPLALFKKITDEEPVPLRQLNPKIPRRVETLVARLMEKDREQRIQSARALVESIDAILEGRRTQVLRRRGRSTVPWIAGAAGAVLLAAVAAAMHWGSEGSRTEPAQPPPKAAQKVVSEDLPLKKPLEVLVTDFEMVSADPPDESFQIAIPDMLIGQLSQYQFLTLPTRREMLGKLYAFHPDARGVRDRYRDTLLQAYEPDLYVTGSYHLRGGRLQINLECYRIRGGMIRIFGPRPYRDIEDRFFDLIDRMTADLVQALRVHAETTLAVRLPDQKKAVIPAHQVFENMLAQAGFLQAVDRQKGQVHEAGKDAAVAEARAEALDGARFWGMKGAREGGAGLAGTPSAGDSHARGRRGYRAGGSEEKSQGAGKEKSEAKIQPAGGPRALALGKGAGLRGFRKPGDLLRWIYSVQRVCDQIKDPELAGEMRRLLMTNRPDLKAIDRLNVRLGQGNGEEVWVVCCRHGRMVPGRSGCWNCGRDLRVVLHRKAGDQRRK